MTVEHWRRSRILLRPVRNSARTKRALLGEEAWALSAAVSTRDLGAPSLLGTGKNSRECGFEATLSKRNRIGAQPSQRRRHL
jgi:hypothetical protein